MVLECIICLLLWEFCLYIRLVYCIILCRFYIYVAICDRMYIFLRRFCVHCLYCVDLCCTGVYIVLYSVDFMYMVCVASICVVLEFTLSCIASILCAMFTVYVILEYTLLYIVSILCTLFVLHQLC